jgi:hypothetical protein
MTNRATTAILGLLLILGLVGLLYLTTGSSEALSPNLQATSTLSQPTFTPIDMPSDEQPAIETQAINLNEMVNGQLEVGKWDIWTFEGQANQVVTITLNSIQFDAYLELYGPGVSQTPLVFDDDSGRATNAQLQEIVLPLTGTYRIFARSFDDSGEGLYRLYLQEGTGLGAFLEDSLPIQYGAYEVGQMGQFESVYEFEGQAGDIVTILLSSADFDPFLTLVDAEGNIVGENDDNGRNRNAALVNVALAANGSYYIFAAPYELISGGTFLLELYETSVETDTTGGAIAIGDTVSGHLAPNTFAEWHFEGQAGQVISAGVITDPFAERLDLFMELYGPNDELIETDDDSGIILNPAITDVRLPAAGEYRVRIRESAPTIGGDYFLTLTEGRAYFGPEGDIASLIVLNDNGAGVTPLHVFSETGRVIDLWLIAGVDETPFVIDLQTSGGEASLDDFVIRLFDTDWVLLADSTEGKITLETLSEFSSEYLVLIEYIGRAERDYQLMFQSGDMPLIERTPVESTSTLTPTPTAIPTEQVPSPLPSPQSNARGEVLAGQPRVDVLSPGLTHRWQFTAPVAAQYAISLTNLGGVYDPFLIVEDVSGAVLAADDDSLGDFDAQIVLDLEAGETIMIIASSFAEQSGGRYQLLVEGDESVPTPIPQTPTPTVEPEEPPRI